MATDDFVQDAQAAAATRDTIADSLLTGLTTLPIGSSASGFTYRVDPALGGAIVRSSDSFGPVFTERSADGRARTRSLGVSWQHASFDAIDGRQLRDGSLIATESTFGNGSCALRRGDATLRMDTDSATISGTSGSATVWTSGRHRARQDLAQRRTGGHLSRRPPAPGVRILDRIRNRGPGVALQIQRHARLRERPGDRRRTPAPDGG